jgi:hypothetical protein
MAVEATFQINAKNKNIVIDDIRAIAIRLNNLIASKSNGLPNNSEINAGVHSYQMEEANSTNLALIRESINDAISKYIKEGSPSVNVAYVDPPEGSLELRKMLQVKVTVANTGATGYSTIVMNLSQSSGRLVMNDINVV